MSITRAVLSNSGSHAVLLARQLNSATRRTCLEVVSGCSPTDRNVLTVSCHLSAGQFVEQWHDGVGEPPAKHGIVDVGDRAPRPEFTVGDGRAWAVPDPGDLDRIRQRVEEVLHEWGDARRTVVYLDGANDLLDHVTLPSLTDFLDRLTSSLSSIGASGCAAFETAAHGERTVRPVTETFDAVFEIGRPGRCLEPVDGAPSPEVLFEVLSARRQRLVLRHLLRSEGSLNVRDLTRRVATSEIEDRPDPERVRARLYHVDLPKLRDAGLITVEGDVVSATEAITAVEPHLALTPRCGGGDG